MSNYLNKCLSIYLSRNDLLCKSLTHLSIYFMSMSNYLNKCLSIYLNRIETIVHNFFKKLLTPCIGSYLNRLYLFYSFSFCFPSLFSSSLYFASFHLALFSYIISFIFLLILCRFFYFSIKIILVIGVKSLNFTSI